MNYLDYDADVVFFGDSITSGGDFQMYFSNERIVNLGIPGDSLLEMINRVEMISAVSPEKVFIMGGINSLTDTNFSTCYTWYKNLISAVKEEVPNAQLYIQSILPISKEKEKACADNSVIIAFNGKLAALAEEYNCEYVDLNSLYVKDGFMNPELTKDGVHLQPEAYDIWAEAIRDYIKE